MPLFWVGSDAEEAEDNDPIESRDVEGAIKSFVSRDLGGLSDHFEVYARGEGDASWQIFPVTLETVVEINVGNASDGPDVGGDR